MFLALLVADHILQQTTANTEQIEDIEERMQSLGELLRSPVGDQDAEEKARRTALRKYVFLFQETGTCLIALLVCRKLAGIVAELGSLSDQHGLVKFFKNVDHANTLNGLVQGLAYAVTDYQVRCGCADAIASAV